MSGAADFDHISELFAEFGPIGIRRMFGGAGLFVDGTMFGIVDDGVIYLKADERTIPAFMDEGQGPFAYDTKTGTHTLKSYWRLPERLYDDPGELALWARRALEVARRSAPKKKPIPRTPRKRARKRF